MINQKLSLSGVEEHEHTEGGTTISHSENPISLDQSKNCFHAGVQYTHTIAKNTNAWVNAGLGQKKTRHYEVGIGYDFTKNIGLDVAYKYYSFEPDSGFKVTNQGLYVNLGFKF